MWDNMENFWRSIMAQDQFVVTPSNYTKQLEEDYRNSSETVTYNELEDARHKCVKWLTDNKDHFSLNK